MYDFSGGLNIKSAPQELADNELTQALNSYLRPDGGVESRRGLKLYKNLKIAAPVIGLFRFAQFVKAANEKTFTQNLAQCNDTLYDLDQGVILGVGNGNNVPGNLGKNSLPWTVAVASDPQANPLPNTAVGGLTDVAVICTGSAGPYIYDGDGVYTPSGWKNAKHAKYCQTVNGVVWFGGIKKFPNQVMSTGSGQVTGDSFEAIAGYSVFDFGQPVTGLSVVGSGAQAMLVVGLNHGFGLVYGTGPANYTQQLVQMDNDGVTSGHSMVSQNGVLYFLGNNNTYSYNPLTQANPAPFSLKVQPWITADPFTGGYPMQGSRSSVFAWMYNDRYQVVYSSEVAGVPDTVLVYDTNIQNWTVLQTALPMFSACLINAPGDPAPSASLVGSLGGKVYVWDPYVAQENAFWDGCAWNVAVWDDSTDNTDAGSVINTWIATKFFKVGEPGTVKSLHRIYPEIVYPGTFTGTATVQTDYALEATFTEAVVASTPSLAQWDISMWDASFWSVSPVPRSSLNAPQSRIDVTAQLPTYPYNYMQWNISEWNQTPWGANPLPTFQSPGIQGEAFSMGMQSGVVAYGSVWDQAIWDSAQWSGVSQLPWIFSGITGSFAQNARR